MLCLVKGSPEAIGTLLHPERHGGKPSWYEATYRGLAEEGLRVLALAYKRCDCDGAEPAEAAARYAQRPREWVESDLCFAGFVAFGCPVRKDSAHVIGALVESGHSTHMLTGDAALTAIHVAKEVGMLDAKADAASQPPANASGAAAKPKAAKAAAAAPVARTLLLAQRAGVAQPTAGGDFEWVFALGSGGGAAAADGAAAAAGAGAAGAAVAPFSAAGVAALRAKGHGLVVTGKVWEALAAVEPAAWGVAGEVRVYARMSPEGKEEVIRAMREHGKATLMCGDGGNDVGALKSADVGASLPAGV